MPKGQHYLAAVFRIKGNAWLFNIIHSLLIGHVEQGEDLAGYGYIGVVRHAFFDQFPVGIMQPQQFFDVAAELGFSPCGEKETVDYKHQENSQEQINYPQLNGQCFIVMEARVRA